MKDIKNKFIAANYFFYGYEFVFYKFVVNEVSWPVSVWLRSIRCLHPDTDNA